MKVTFLGTGTSQGVPMIGCKCEVCTSSDPLNQRLRSAIWVRDEHTSVIIDTGPDFRYQMLRANVEDIDAIVYTHGHKDHVAGLDDIRAYNYWHQKDIFLYANDHTEEIIRREFAYAFGEFKYPGIPQFNLQSITGVPFTIGTLTFIPIKVMHYKLEVYGYRIGDFTYITDANYIAPEELEKIFGTKVLVLNALRHETHISHFTLNEAIEIAQQVKPMATYFTHISHQLGLHQTVTETLPKAIHLAYDGLTIEI